MELVLRPDVLRWARERASLDEAALAKKVGTSAGRVASWEQDGRLAAKQAEKVARATHTPLGLLYLPSPPEERLPVPDFRTLTGEGVRRPSPELLDVLDAAQQRQDWFREYLAASGEPPLSLVGDLERREPVVAAAARIRAAMGLDTRLRAAARTWEEALRLQIDQIEEHGVMVMRSGIVGSDTHRPLSVDEFRGFALSDPYAPLIFINGKDAKGAQMFTLIHELVHIWLGVSGVSNLLSTLPIERNDERFCNEIAAEILVPADELRSAWTAAQREADSTSALARRFKVSGIVVLRRLLDLALISRELFFRRYGEQEERARDAAESSEGGDFYRTQRSRTGERFAKALIESTLEGRTPYREALRLLGMSKIETFRKFARELRFAV